MEQKLSQLQTALKSLTKNFLQLAKQLSKAKQELESNLIPPSLALVGQITSEQARFAQLRRQVVELAQFSEVITPDIDNIISLEDLEKILKSVANAEETVSETSRKALDILGNVFQIRYSDAADFPPFQQCIAKADELRSLILNSQEYSLHPEVKALVSGEHPFAQLLERQSTNIC